MPTQSKFVQKLDWNLLKTFHQIVKAKGVTNAAELTLRKQPALSTALRRLETHLERVLCRRGPSGFELTKEGIIAAETCEQIIHLLQELPERIMQASGGVKEQIRLNLVSNIVCNQLDNAISSIHKSKPSMEMQVSVAPWAQIIDDLLRDEIDIGIAPASHKRPELNYVLLFEEINTIFCGRDHPLFGKQVDKPSDLRRERFILTGADEPREMAEYRLEYGLGERVAAVTEHLEEAKRLTVIGFGLCFLPERYAETEVEAGLLWPILPRELSPSIKFFAITNPGTERSRTAEIARDELLEQLSSPPFIPEQAPE